MTKEQLRDMTEPPTCPICDTAFYTKLAGCRGCGHKEEEPKRTFTQDDIAHALAYGYMGRRSGLSHGEVLANYKKANNI